MTDISLPASAVRQGRSVEGYLNQLEAARRWRREHPAQVQARLNYSPCDCGKLKHRRASRCIECRRAADAERVQERRSYIRSCWATGMIVSEIAAALDMNPGTLRVEMHHMRNDGWDLPYRRPRGKAKA